MTFECIHNALSVCSVYMDGALVTFDGARNKIYGTAQYIVAEQKSGDFCKPAFKVSMSTENNGNLTSLVKMYLMFEKEDGTMMEVETTSEGKSYFYHNKTDWKRLYPQTTEDFVFEKTGRKHYLKTWSGIEYLHVERRFEVRLPSVYDNTLAGLCQNKNGDITDDYTVKNGTVLPFPDQNTDLSTWQGYEVATSFIAGSASRRGCLPYDPDQGGDEEEPEDDSDSGFIIITVQLNILRKVPRRKIGY